MKRAAVVLLLALMLVSLNCDTSSSARPRIGALFSLTGPNALYGTWGYNGVEVATDVVNDRGESAARKLSW